MIAELLEGAVRRSPLQQGASGARLERVELPDGRVLVIKWMRRGADWQMRVTKDPGVRDQLLFTEGVLDRIPQPLAHPVLDTAELDGEVAIVMRDVSDGLVPAGSEVSRATTRRILESAAAMHKTFRGATVSGLCELTDRYRLLSPGALEAERNDPSPLPRFALLGWERFPDVVPDDISTAVFHILERPDQLATALERCGTTLIHGDLHLGNVAILDDEVVLLDWGLLTTIAPAAVELAYLLVMRDHHARLVPTNEELIADFIAVEPETSPRELRLALVGSLVMFGWRMALQATIENPDQNAARAELDWWTQHAREGLQEL